MSFGEYHDMFWKCMRVFVLLNFPEERLMIFIRFWKGSVTQKIKNHCSRVSNPVTISGAIPQTGKRETYLSSLPSTELCILTDHSSEITETGCALWKFRVKSSFLQLLNKANCHDSPNKFALKPLRKEMGVDQVVKEGTAEYVLPTFLMGPFLKISASKDHNGNRSQPQKL